MKKVGMVFVVVATLIFTSGCVKKRAQLNQGTPVNIAVLTLDGDLKGRTLDQEKELDVVIRWMDRDLIKNLNRSGFNAVLLKDPNKYTTSMGLLFKAEVEDFNPGNRAARVFVGFGAGSASLDMKYTLLNNQKQTLLDWKDGVGSSKGGTYCAQTLNQKTIAKLVAYLNKG